MDFWPLEGKLVVSAPNAHPPLSLNISFAFNKLYVKLGVFPAGRPVLAEILNIETQMLYTSFQQGVLRLEDHGTRDEGKDLFLCDEGHTEEEFLYKAYKVCSTHLLLL